MIWDKYQERMDVIGQKRQQSYVRDSKIANIIKEQLKDFIGTRAEYDEQCMNLARQIKADNIIVDNLYRTEYVKIINDYMSELFSEYRHIPLEILDIIYGLAYEESHSYGYGEVESKFEDFLDTCVKIYKIGFENGKHSWKES